MHATLQHKAQLYRQLHLGAQAAVPLERLLQGRELPPPWAAKAARIISHLRQGRALSKVLRTAGITSHWENSLLELGEEGGRLAAVLRDLADFFETRQRQLATLRSRMIYPALVVVAAILLQPLPALAAGTLAPGAYGLGVAWKLGALYALWRLVLVRLLALATGAAFNPLLLRLLPHVDSQHWLRLQHEAAYLDLVTLCLDCGLDAASTLRLLRDGCDDAEYRQRHAFALQQIEHAGLSLTQALFGTGLLRNAELHSFVKSAEESGTLHGDLRQYLARKRSENAANLDYRLRKLALWLYIGAMLLSVAVYF